MIKHKPSDAGSAIVAAINLFVLAAIFYGGVGLLLIALVKLAWLLDTNDTAYALTVGFLIVTIIFLFWRTRR